jgi:hypothetical protein
MLRKPQISTGVQSGLRIPEVELSSQPDSSGHLGQSLKRLVANLGRLTARQLWDQTATGREPSSRAAYRDPSEKTASQKVNVDG